MPTGGVEALEPRRLLAASLSASLSGGHLLVEGTDAADTLLVRSTRKRISVQRLAVRAASGKVRQVKVRQVKAAAVSLIEVRTLGGDDVVSVDESRHPLRAALSIQGGDGNDTLGGGSGDDNLDGGAGDDTIHGGDGHDTVNASEGNDVVNGGGGEDLVDGGPGNDTLGGDDGNDTLRGGGDDDALRAGEGSDLLHGDGGNDTLDGDAGDDWLSGGEGVDAARGGDGTDAVYGDGGDDDVRGGPGDDFLDAGAGNDAVGADEGDDRAWGGAGDDVVSAGDGHDVVFGGPGSDTLDGAAGHDALVDEPGAAQASAAPARGGPGRDRLYAYAAGQRLSDHEPHDAALTLAEGGAGEARRWSDKEITWLDAGLRWLHGVAAPLLRLPDGRPLTLQRGAEGAAAGAGSADFAAQNDLAGHITFYDRAFTGAQELAESVVHEVGHNWQGQAHWDEFLSLSAWHRDATPDLGETPSTNLSGLSADDWVFAAGAPFAREYGREDPQEDWATTWEMVYQQDTGNLALSDAQRLARKLELVRRFFGGMA